MSGWKTVLSISDRIPALVEVARETNTWTGLDDLLREVFSVGHPSEVYVCALRMTQPYRDHLLYWDALRKHLYTTSSEDVIAMMDALTV